MPFINAVRNVREERRRISAFSLSTTDVTNVVEAGIMTIMRALSSFLHHLGGAFSI
jgi:hypothetical protein